MIFVVIFGLEATGGSNRCYYGHYVKKTSTGNLEANLAKLFQNDFLLTVFSGCKAYFF